jgi:anti-sigma regulatory factor (Ser/Thr protein kinase)
MALVELTLAPLAAHVRTARLVGVAAARRAGLEPELIDELRLALGEACSRAVGLHARHAQEAPVRITVSDDSGGLTITVTDEGPAAGPVPDDPAGDMLGGDADDDDLVDPDVALAVLSGLVDDYAVEATATGTTITLRWPLPAGAEGPGSTQVAQA